MTALIIIGSFLLLILLLLCFSARVRISYDDDLKIVLRYLFLHFTLYPQKPKKEKKAAEKKPTNAKKQVDKSVEYNGFAETFNQLKGAIMPIFSSLGKLTSHIRINPLNVRLVTAGKDAAELAIDYGRLCSVFYPFLAFLCSKMQVGKKNIYLGVNYTAEKYEIKIDLTVKIRIIFALITGIRLLLPIIKIKVNNILKQNKVKSTKSAQKALTERKTVK